MQVAIARTIERPRWGHLFRAGCIGAATVLVLIGGAWFIVRTIAELRASPTLLGADAVFYFAHTSDWLHGGPFYPPFELAGPFIVEHGGAVYPPIAILLFAPWAVGAPLVLWWAIPLGTLALALRRLRPAPWAWPFMAALLFYPRTWVVLVLGNPSMWAMAAGVAGLAFGWPALAALIKPTFAPLALLGCRDRRWQVGLLLAAIISLGFGSLWVDYVHVLQNAQTSRGLDYLAGEWPIAIVLLVVAMSSRPTRRAAS